jgi:hypothetical protein
MECSEVGRYLPGYLMDDLDAEVRAGLEAHCQGCAACSRELRASTALWSELGSLTEIAPPDSLATRFSGILAAYEAGRAAPAGEEGPGAPGAGRAGWWPLPPLGQAAAAVLLLVAGAAAGAGMGGNGATGESLRSLEGEVRTLHQLVALSMMGQRTASQRLQGVTWTTRLDTADSEVLRTLLDTLNYDPNANVRLGAIDALGRFGQESQVRDGLLASLERQETPIVQVFLIDLLVELGESRSVEVFERLSRNESVHEAVRERAVWGISQLG